MFTLNIELIIIPTANAELDTIAMAASPLILLFSFIFNRKTADTKTIGIETCSGVTFAAAAIANAPKPT